MFKYVAYSIDGTRRYGVTQEPRKTWAWCPSHVMRIVFTSMDTGKVFAYKLRLGGHQ